MNLPGNHLIGLGTLNWIVVIVNVCWMVNVYLSENDGCEDGDCLLIWTLIVIWMWICVGCDDDVIFSWIYDGVYHVFDGRMNDGLFVSVIEYHGMKGYVLLLVMHYVIVHGNVWSIVAQYLSTVTLTKTATVQKLQLLV